MSILLERARLLAKFVHAGQTRRNSDPYYTHCDAVEAEGINESENTKCAAQMHDIKEDAKNPELIMKVIKEYFPSEVYELIEILSHNKYISYKDYIDIVCSNPKAMSIKFSDIIHNTKDVNLLPEKQFNKYRNACQQMINNEINVPKILRERLKIGE